MTTPEKGTPNNQSYRLWLDAADQCPMLRGIYIHIMLSIILKYQWKYTIKT